MRDGADAADALCDLHGVHPAVLLQRSYKSSTIGNVRIDAKVPGCPPDGLLGGGNGAAAEGAAVGNARTSLKTPKTFYTQIFREPYSISGTAENTKTYGPISIRSEQQKK